MGEEVSEQECQEDVAGHLQAASLEEDPGFHGAADHRHAVGGAQRQAHRGGRVASFANGTGAVPESQEVRASPLPGESNWMTPSTPAAASGFKAAGSRARRPRSSRATSGIRG